MPISLATLKSEEKGLYDIIVGRQADMNNFNITNFIKCKYDCISSLSLTNHNSHRGYTENDNNHRKYFIIPADLATGILYITKNSPGFISGHLRMRGKTECKYW